jgi:hypothetical protein
MLRNILSARPAAGLHRVGFWRLDSGMDGYLAPFLIDRWPRLRIERYHDDETLHRLNVDVWVCGEEPLQLPTSPALILGAIAARPAVDRVAANAWRIATPINGRRFVADIQRLLVPEP